MLPRPKGRAPRRPYFGVALVMPIVVVCASVTDICDADANDHNRLGSLTLIGEGCVVGGQPPHAQMRREVC